MRHLFIPAALFACILVACAPNPDIGSSQLSLSVRHLLETGSVNRFRVGRLLGPPTQVSAMPAAHWNRNLTEEAWPVATREIWSYYAKDVSGHRPLDPYPVSVHTTLVAFGFDADGELTDVRQIDLLR